MDHGDPKLLAYLSQQHFPEKEHTGQPLPSHLHGLQAGSSPIHCTLYCADMTLKADDKHTIRFDMKPSPLGACVVIEISLFPIISNATEQDRARHERSRVWVTFSAYDDNSSSQYGGRKPYNYEKSTGNEAPRGQHNFSDQLMGFEFRPGDDSGAPPIAPTGGQYAPKDVNVFSWQAKRFTKFRFGMSPSDNHVATLSKMLDAMQSGKKMFAIARPNTIQRGLTWPWFSAAPSPVPHSFFPWIDPKPSDPLKIQDMIKVHPNGSPEMWSSYIDRAFGVRGSKGWIKKANADEINCKDVPAPLKIGRMLNVTMFRDEREYLAHVLIGYLYEEWASKQSLATHLNGYHKCMIMPHGSGATPAQYLILLNVRPPKKTGDEHATEAFALPEEGEKVTINVEYSKMNQDWSGKVVHIPNEHLGFAANTCIVAEAEATTPNVGRILAPTFVEALFHFGHHGQSTWPARSRMVNLMYQERQEFKFWKNVLLAQDNYTMGDGTKYNKSTWKAPANFQEKLDKVCKERNLNKDQVEIVKHYFKHQLTVVRGPPGTGKSTLIDALIELEVAAQSQLWVCADSNAAVDVLTSKTCKRLKFLHPINHYRVKPIFEETLTVEKSGDQVEIVPLALPPAAQNTAQNPNAKQEAMDKLFKMSQNTKRAMSLEAMIATRLKGIPPNSRLVWPEERDDLHNLGKALKSFEILKLEPHHEKEYAEQKQSLEKKYLLELRSVQQKYVAQASVVYSTAASASSPLLHDIKPVGLIVDEASQAQEAKLVSAIVHALMGKKLCRVLLIGDDKQLPPTVTAERNPFAATVEMSLLERLSLSGFPCHTLRTQYRMHPDISSIVDQLIYSRILDFQGLENGPNTTEGEGVQKFRNFIQHLGNFCGQKIPVTHEVVISPVQNASAPTDWQSKKQKGSTSRYNLATARIVIQLVFMLISQGKYAAKDIMVIAFYADQVQLLKAIARKSEGLVDLRISTVDSSQGSEAEVVIIDCVVLGAASNDTMGFLGHDIRRFNVAMSRAQKGRLTIAHKDMIKPKENSAIWKPFLDQAKKRNTIVNAAKLNQFIPNTTVEQNVASTFKLWQSRANTATNEAVAHVNLVKNTAVAAQERKTKDDVQLFMDLVKCQPSVAEHYLKLHQTVTRAVDAYMTEHASQGDIEEIVR